MVQSLTSISSVSCEFIVGKCTIVRQVHHSLSGVKWSHLRQIPNFQKINLGQLFFFFFQKLDLGQLLSNK